MVGSIGQLLPLQIAGVGRNHYVRVLVKQTKGNARYTHPGSALRAFKICVSLIAANRAELRDRFDEAGLPMIS